jgi:hypothetical protein
MLKLNLYLTLEKHKGDIRKMLIHWKEQLNFKVGRGPSVALMTTYQDNKTIREMGSSKARSNFHCEINQCCGFPVQAFKFYENPSYVSCFLVRTLPCIYHSKKNP